MRDSRRLILPVLAVAAVVVLAVAGARRTAASAEGAAGPPGISAADRAATFHFAPDTAAAGRDAGLAAGPRAPPPARPPPRLARRPVGLVGGLTDVRVGPTGSSGVLGLTESRDGRYAVTLDLRTVAARYGRRGIDRVGLQELGHAGAAAP